jgi:hypothetical protein
MLCAQRTAEASAVEQVLSWQVVDRHSRRWKGGREPHLLKLGPSPANKAAMDYAVCSKLELPLTTHLIPAEQQGAGAGSLSAPAPAPANASPAKPLQLGPVFNF